MYDGTLGLVRMEGNGGGSKNPTVYIDGPFRKCWKNL